MMNRLVGVTEEGVVRHWTFQSELEQHSIFLFKPDIYPPFIHFLKIAHIFCLVNICCILCLHIALLCLLHCIDILCNLASLH